MGLISGVSYWKGHWLFLQAWACQSRASQWFDGEFVLAFVLGLGSSSFHVIRKAHQPTNAVRLGTTYSIWFSLPLANHRSNQDKSETQLSLIKENYLLAGYSLRDKWWWGFLYGRPIDCDVSLLLFYQVCLTVVAYLEHRQKQRTPVTQPYWSGSSAGHCS